MLIDEITNALIILVRVGIIARIIFCLIKMLNAEDEATKYKLRIKNAIIFYIIAESAWQIRDLVFYYYR